MLSLLLTTSGLVLFLLNMAGLRETVLSLAIVVVGSLVGVFGLRSNYRWLSILSIAVGCLTFTVFGLIVLAFYLVD